MFPLDFADWDHRSPSVFVRHMFFLFKKYLKTFFFPLSLYKKRLAPNNGALLSITLCNLVDL